MTRVSGRIEHVTETYWDWRPLGRCKRLSYQESDRLFFPKAGRSINEAKSFCSACQVYNQCLEYALANKLPGIWAGTNESERRRILKLKDKASGVVRPRKIVQRRNITFK